MNNERPIVAEHQSIGTSVSSLVVGFGLSILLTVTAYIATTHHSISHVALVAVLVALALVQFIVQLIFFLHLGLERGPRWKTGVLLMMLLVVAIVVFGSLWIMNHLNYHMMHMTQQQTNTYLHDHESI